MKENFENEPIPITEGAELRLGRIEEEKTKTVQALENAALHASFLVKAIDDELSKPEHEQSDEYFRFLNEKFDEVSGRRKELEAVLDRLDEQGEKINEHRARLEGRMNIEEEEAA